MNAEDIARHCESPKRTAADRWIARCPAHSDKTPSLAIRDGLNGGVVLHCFAGCEVDSIVAALGLKITDLFPDKAPTDYKPQRVQGIHPMDALAALARESLVVLVAAAEVSDGKPLDTDGRVRLAQAVGRILAARELASA